MENDLNIKIRQIDKLSKSINGTSAIHNKSEGRLSRKDLCDKLRVEPVNTKQRSSSLSDGSKSRKSVSFADNFGIGVDIRVYDSNLPPEIPDYVLSDLIKCRSHTPSPDIVPAFSYNHNFESINESKLLEIMKTKNVCLSRLVIMDDKVFGMVSVSNISPEKTVFVRFTTNKWVSHTDYEGNFCSTLSPTIDQFSFQICVSSLCCMFGAVMEFAICYRSGGQEFWDNNNNNNYKIMKYILQN